MVSDSLKDWWPPTVLQRDLTLLSPREVVRLYRNLDLDPAVLFDASRNKELLNSSEIQRLLSATSPDRSLQERLIYNLQCLAVFNAQESVAQSEIDLVGTFPGGFDTGARSIRMVVREMLNAANDEVVVLGYEVTDEDFLNSVARIANRCKVIFVVDRSRGSVEVIQKSWPDSISREPLILVNASRKDEARYAKMHSKGLIVDGDDLLITSANLTFHGFSGNIELGVRVRGQSATRARSILDRLIQQGLLEDAG